MDDQELLRRRDWLEARQLKEAAKRPYVRLPDGHPDFDAEDLPWPMSWLVEAWGALVLVAIVLAVAVISQPLGPMFVDALDWLSAAIPGD